MKLVLIVEDEILIQAFDESVLQEAGCETLTAANYDEVAELMAEGHKPDLALIDGNLSDGATGNKVAHVIREHAPDARVVYTSANINDEVRSQFVAETEILPKPYTPDELQGLVAEEPAAPQPPMPAQAAATSIRKRA